MSLNKIFTTLMIWFLVGIFFTNILFNIDLIISFFSISLMFLLIVFTIMKKHHFFVLFLFFWLSFWVLYWINNNSKVFYKNYLINNYSEANIIWEVKSIYKKEESYNSYIVKVLEFDWKIIDTNFLLKTSKSLQLNYKDIIYLKTKVDKIDNFTDKFNYEKYLNSKNIFFISNYPDITEIKKQKLNKYESIIIHSRQSIINSINNIYPKSEADLLSWILIWHTQDISKQMQENYNNSWLSHLMAVSWFNITIIIIFLWFLLNYFPIYVRFFVIFSFIIFFTLIVWDNVPVLRASIMWIIWYIILISWRQKHNFTLLLLTAFVLVLINPLYLNYDSSFHLSFLAVIWLLYTKNFWDKVFFFMPKYFAIKESFVLTISALTTTLPIIIFSFGQISVLTPIANMLVWGIIPFAMLFWFLSILWSIFFIKLWFLLGFLNYFLLKFVNKVAEVFWNLDNYILKFEFGREWIYFQIIYFIILIFLILYFKKEEKVEVLEK